MPSFRAASWLLVASLAELSCAGRGSLSKTEDLQQGLGAVTDAPGYQHSLAASRFDVGDNPTSVEEMGWQKVEGSLGVFATDSITGAVRAIPNGASGLSSAPGITNDPNANSDYVLSYFEGCGLPAAQVASVNVHTLMANGGPGSAPRPPGTDQFIAYYSIVNRAVSGVPVSESFAWARFNAAGQSVSEAVYWPTIPSAAISDALSLKAKLADPSAGPQYLASLRLSGPSIGGTVRIHHTKSFSRLPFQAIATYDVHEEPSSVYPRGRTLHYDPSGNGTELPDDVAAKAQAATVGTIK